MSERDVPRVPHLLDPDPAAADGDGDADGGDAGDVSSLVRAALRGARADVPDAAKMNALSAAIAGAVSAGGGGGEPPGADPSDGGAGSGAAPGAGAGGAIGATKLALGGVAVVAAIGVALFATRAAPVELAADAGPTTTTSSSSAPRAALPATAIAPAAGSEPVLDVHALPAAPAPDAGRAAASVAATSSARSRGSAEAEMTLLRSAQDALAGAPADALARCDEHARTYPDGALADEREILAVDALMRLGRRGEAEARAARFRVAHPGSAYLRRLDTLLGKTD